MSDAIVLLHGAVERSIDAGTTWVPIPEAKGIAIPTVETDFVDVTSLDSDGFREFKRGLKDPGVITIPCNYTSAGYELMLADEARTDATMYRCTLDTTADQTSGDTFAFSGFPVPKVENPTVGDAILMNVDVRASGAVTWTRGTAAV